MAFKAVLFDLDGTLVNTYDKCLSAAQMASHALNLKVIDEDIYRRCYAFGGDELRLLFTQEPTLKSLDHALKKNWIAHYLHNAHHHEVSTLYTSSRKWLQILKNQGVFLYIVTNNDMAQANKKLKHLQIFDYFDGVFGPENHHDMKPDPYLFEQIKILHREFTLDDYVMVGDTLADIGFAKNCGIKIGWVAYGHGDRAACLNAQPDFVFENRRDLDQWIKSF